MPDRFHTQKAVGLFYRVPRSLFRLRSLLSAHHVVQSCQMTEAGRAVAAATKRLCQGRAKTDVLLRVGRPEGTDRETYGAPLMRIRLSPRDIHCLLTAAIFAYFAEPSAAMEFVRAGPRIVATGEIIVGDTDKFSRLAATLPRDEGTGAPEIVVSLDSPGGSLFEGMRLGMAIRRVGVPTLVEQNNLCASACAIAFLGGKASGVAASAVQRRLQWGAKLAFHGYKFGDDNVRIVNETLDISRVMNAIVLAYAERMGAVDLGMLAILMNVTPERVELVDTPRELQALGVGLEGETPKLPKGWARNACQAVVAAQLPVFDPIGPDDRIIGELEPMPHLGAFRQRFLEDKYPAGPKTTALRTALNALPAGDALDLLAGEAMHLDKAKVGAWRVRLDRGAGFYFDACYAVTDFQTIKTILVDGVGPATTVVTTSTIAGYPRDAPLW